MTTNTERQRRLRQRRKEAGLVDYRRAVTPEQAKALDELLANMNRSGNNKRSGGDAETEAQNWHNGHNTN